MTGKGPTILKCCVGFGLLASLFVLVDRAALRDVLGRVNGWILVSLPVFYAHTAVKALRWRLYLRAQGVTLGLWEAGRMYTSGTFLGLISPGRVGEVYRAWILHRERDVSPGLGLASVLVDRMADVAVLLSAGAAGMAYLAGIGTGTPGMAAGLAFVPGTARVRAFFRKQFRQSAKLMPAEVAAELPRAYREFVRSLGAMGPVLLAKITALTIVSVLIYCGHLYFIARVLGLPVGFWELTGILCASAFVNLIPITINAIGTRDAFLMATLPLVGVARAEALGFSLIFLLLFVANTLMAMPCWIYSRDSAPRKDAV